MCKLLLTSLSHYKISMTGTFHQEKAAKWKHPNSFGNFPTWWWKETLDERIKGVSSRNMHSFFLDKLPALRYIIHIYDKKLPALTMGPGRGTEKWHIPCVNTGRYERLCPFAGWFTFCHGCACLFFFFCLYPLAPQLLSQPLVPCSMVDINMAPGLRVVSSTSCLRYILICHININCAFFTKRLWKVLWKKLASWVTGFQWGLRLHYPSSSGLLSLSLSLSDFGIFYSPPSVEDMPPCPWDTRQVSQCGQCKILMVCFT